MPKVKPTDDVLAAALASINQDFGDGSVLLLDDAEAMDVVAISSGSMNLDEALGIGGYPEGRIVEIAGNESSGKTTLALHAIAEAHKKGGMCAFVDAEHSLDPKYAEAIGCDLKRIVISQPDNGEQGLEIANRLIATGEFAVVVIDSVAALTPKTEIEGEMGDANVGKHARLMSQAMRKMVANIKDTHTVLILINQIREKIGVMYGPNTTTTGGRAIKFFASVRLDISRIQTLKDKEVAVGNRTRVKVVKNKVASPHKVAEFDITYGIGINRTAELLDLSVDHGVIKKSGAWYSYKGDNIGQGKVAAVDFLNETTETYDSVKADLNRLRENNDT